MNFFSKSVLMVTLGLATVQCRSLSQNEDSSAKDRDSSADPLSEPFGLRVNLTTNMATFFENGKAIRTWKVASARNDGKSQTPTGKFRFHEMTTCVSWKSTRNDAQTGPCSSDNPLGFRALWFYSSSYGLHGVDSSHVSSVTGSTAESRRQSSGCVRNHPEDIKWLTDKVAGLYGANPQELANRVAGRRESTLQPVGRGLALEIGNWTTDVAIGYSPNGAMANFPSLPPRPNAPAFVSPIVPVTEEQGKACTTEVASGFVNSPSPLTVLSYVDRPGSPEIGKTKPFEMVCPTENYLNGQVQVFFPLAPRGFGWVDANHVVVSCFQDPALGYGSLNECLSKEVDKSRCVQMCQQDFLSLDET